MPQIIPVDSRAPRYQFTITLDGVDVGLRLYWLPRAAGWYLDLLTPDGEDVATGIRVTPDAPLAVPGSWEGAPPGRFVVLGPARYGYSDLGSQVRIVYLTSEEVEAARAA